MFKIYKYENRIIEILSSAFTMVSGQVVWMKSKETLSRILNEQKIEEILTFVRFVCFQNIANRIDEKFMNAIKYK